MFIFLKVVLHAVDVVEKKIGNRTVREKTQFKFYLPTLYSSDDKTALIQKLINNYPFKLFFKKNCKDPDSVFDSYSFDVADADEITNHNDLEAAASKNAHPTPPPTPPNDIDVGVDADIDYTQCSQQFSTEPLVDSDGDSDSMKPPQPAKKIKKK